LGQRVEREGYVKAVLREWSDDDAGWYVRQVRDTEIVRFTTERPSLTVDDLLRALDRLRHDDQAIGLAVVDATSGDLLGNIAADRHGDVASVSYWVAPDARGKGVASQALEEMCRRVRSAWPVSAIQLWAHADNVASQRVAENAGFVDVTEDGATMEVDGQQWPVRWYRRE
jgi:RimJ/RimL family protein N-acetyltransferase